MIAGSPFVTAWTPAAQGPAGSLLMLALRLKRIQVFSDGRYRAPELLLKEAATTAADMFSVGVMLARCMYIFTVAVLVSYLFSHLFCFC